MFLRVYADNNKEEGIQYYENAQHNFSDQTGLFIYSYFPNFFVNFV